MAGRFDPNKYVDVQERIDLLKKNFPDSRVVTDLMSDPADFTKCRWRARIYLDPNDPIPTTGHAFEIAGGGGANSGSHEENGETSAIGRALANMGLTGGENRASLQEMAKAMRQSYDAKKGQWVVRDDVDLKAGAEAFGAPAPGAVDERERGQLAAEAEREELAAKKAEAATKRAEAQAQQAQAAAAQREATQRGKARPQGEMRSERHSTLQPAAPAPSPAPQPATQPAPQPAPAPKFDPSAPKLIPDQLKELTQAYEAAKIPAGLTADALRQRFGVESFDQVPAEIAGQDMFTVLCGWIPKLAERAARPAA